jgi:SAM-dependent methyltransferase
MAKFTDNSFFREKVKLRVDNLPVDDPVNVLDVFHGQGLIWKEIVRTTGRRINVLGIDRKPGMSQVYLQGDNRKFQVDYNQFDLIDLDAYGVPYEQLEKIFKQATREIGIFVTFVQSVYGRLPIGFLESLGYSCAMVKKIPSIFFRHGQQKLLDYLSLHCVHHVKIYQTDNKRKTYIFFKINASK